MSVWLSVDPLAHKYPSFSPYVFTGNNPLNLIDPNGESIWTTEDSWKIVRQGIEGVLGRKQDVFSRDSETGKVLFNKDVNLSNLDLTQEEFVEKYKSLVKDKDYDVNVYAVDYEQTVSDLGMDSEGRVQLGLSLSDGKGANGKTVPHDEMGEKWSNVYIAKDAKVRENGKLRTSHDYESLSAISSVHELTHSYHFQQGIFGSENSRLTTAFEQRVRDRGFKRVYFGTMKGEAYAH